MANKIHLDSLFAALADPTRRAVVAKLTQGESAVSDLASPYDMALPSFLKHIDRLERAGLVGTRKEGRVRVVTLHPEALSEATHWLDRQRALWEGRLDRMETLLAEMEDGNDL